MDAQYWNSRYLQGQTGWDIGHISPPIKTYIDQLTDTNIKILIPGAGNAYEAIYLFEKGFKNTYVCDWSERVIDNLKERAPKIPSEQILCCDFFQIQDNFDLILEQTFFCALNPDLRPQYVQKVAQLLQPKGRLIGLLFGVEFPKDGPPFGGHQAEYESLFKDDFHIKTMANAHNSIKPRSNKELFINFVKI